jgi:hypothetical protein
MNEFFKILGEAVRDRLNTLTFWQLLLLIVTVIFAAAAANRLFR